MENILEKIESFMLDWMEDVTADFIKALIQQILLTTKYILCLDAVLRGNNPYFTLIFVVIFAIISRKLDVIVELIVHNAFKDIKKIYKFKKFITFFEFIYLKETIEEKAIVFFRQLNLFFIKVKNTLIKINLEKTRKEHILNMFIKNIKKYIEIEINYFYFNIIWFSHVLIRITHEKIINHCIYNSKVFHTHHICNIINLLNKNHLLRHTFLRGFSLLSKKINLF